MGGNQINLDLIKIIQFCWKIYDLWRHPHLWVDVWVNVKLLKIDLDLIKIIQFWTFLLKPPQPSQCIVMTCFTGRGAMASSTP